jgi:AcrR family transcriptional regulator
MGQDKSKQLTRDDWLREALRQCGSGIDNVKIARLARAMGVSTGSFYWHFKDREDLLNSLLNYWEREMTDAAIDAAKQYTGPPAERILYLMDAVLTGGLARYDLPIWLWAQSDPNALRIFKRALRKRFSFAAWMFSEAGFSQQQAAVRGRMMVAYMMADSTLIPGSMAKRKADLRLKHAILTAPE